MAVFLPREHAAQSNCARDLGEKERMRRSIKMERQHRAAEEGERESGADKQLLESRSY